VVTDLTRPLTIRLDDGEKLHEILIAEEECHEALEFEDRFVLEPISPGADERAGS